jgi:hypothetical protein
MTSLLFMLLLAAPVLSARGNIYTLSVPAASPWTDTGIDVFFGQQLSITASGTVRAGLALGGTTDANGVGPLSDGTRIVSDTVLGTTISLSLIGKVGGTTAIGTGTPLLEGAPGKGPGFVGTSYDQEVMTTGRLFLGYNDDIFSDNSGSFSVTVTVVPEPSTMVLVALGALILLGFSRRFIFGTRS